MATSWMQDGNNWYYFDPSSGVMQTGLKCIDGNGYYFDSNGRMVRSDSRVDDNGDWNYFDYDGKMETSEGNWLYQLALDNQISLERGGSKTLYKGSRAGITFTVDLSITEVTNSSAPINITNDQAQFNFPNGNEIDLSKIGASASGSISVDGYKLQLGCTLGAPDSSIFIETSYTPSTATGPKADIKASISMNDLEAIGIIAGATFVAISTDGIALPAILEGAGGLLVEVSTIVTKMLTPNAQQYVH